MGAARSILLAFVVAAAASACGDRDETVPEPATPAAQPAFPATAVQPAAPPPEPEASPADAEALRAAEALAAQLGVGHPAVVLEIEGYGSLRIELLPEKAPKTTANFASLAEKGFYDGTTFHRVIPDFVIQGGDPNSKNRDPRDDGQGGPGYTIPDEPNDLAHTRGVVSMANLGSPHTGSSQFFVLLADRPDLDGHYTAFGRVTEGMEVADRIAAVETDKYGRYGPPDRPRTNVVVKTARLLEPAPGE
jgi:peptidyl-prolyl cis-trans isomerase B (cyclophilin B)